jgi:hypothetical protein
MLAAKAANEHLRFEEDDMDIPQHEEELEDIVPSGESKDKE